MKKNVIMRCKLCYPDYYQRNYVGFLLTPRCPKFISVEVESGITCVHSKDGRVDSQPPNLEIQTLITSC